MTAFALETLPWLLPAPEDFRARTRAIDPATAAAVLARLATHALDLNKLAQLDRALSALPEGVDLTPLAPVRLAVLADATTDYLAPAIRASALRHGIRAELYLPAYGQALAEAMDEAGPLATFGADMALIAQDHRALGLGRVHLDPAAAAATVASALGHTRALLEALGRQGIPTMILQTLPVPPEPWCGHFDRRAPGSVAAQVVAFNEGLARLAAERAAALLDVATLADLVGRTRWFDAALWHRAKLPFALDLVPLYADHVGRLLGALRGKARKCLVLDLDNTLWGGVIGDDGVDGIRLGQGSAEGEAFLAIQKTALALRARGVVLAVCSKNEDDAARLPFRTHPDMALSENDIAVFIANWSDKATNLAHIAKTLNIGTDALVFLDDNPAERARVRQMLPEVAVPELPEDPALYPAALLQAGYFESTGLSADDAQRAEQYRANAARAAAAETIGDYGDYLASLAMECDLRPFDAAGRTRIAQLVNKSNQFNLTTRRYTEAEVAAMEADPSLFTLQIRLTDRFGDNGMISVVIFRKESEEWVCDTWLMSCRVLGRRVEEAALAAVAKAARAEGARCLLGEYIPSAKNRMVAEHFGKLGFDRTAAESDGRTLWRLDLSHWSAPELPMALTGLFPSLAA